MAPARNILMPTKYEDVHLQRRVQGKERVNLPNTPQETWSKQASGTLGSTRGLWKLVAYCNI